MKRYIRTTSAIRQQIANAKEVIKQYSPEQVELVRECVDEENRALSDYYVDESSYDDDYSVGSTISEIKRDYASQAYEDDLLTPEEFDELHEAIETVDIESAASVS